MCAGQIEYIMRDVLCTYTRYLLMVVAKLGRVSADSSRWIAIKSGVGRVQETELHVSTFLISLVYHWSNYFKKAMPSELQ